MNKFIITKFKFNNTELLFRGFTDGKRFYQLGFDVETEKKAVVGDIFVGRVRDIVKNIDAAFIEIGTNEVGYYSLTENHNPVFLNKKNTDKVCQGDLVLVQLKKEAVKTKAPVLTSDISITGKNVVLNINKSGVGISNKISDTDFKNTVKEILQKVLNESEINAGAVVRTNALDEDLDIIKTELISLLKKYRHILETSKTRTAHTKLYSEDESSIKMLKGAYKGEISEIITDDYDIYEKIKSYVNLDDILKEVDVKFYKDDLLPLYKLYSIETVMKEAFSKKVWLKSGAYLVIEPTEAMTVIDVNTGKCIKGKDINKTIFKVNMEAAEEIAYQLKFRNLSGIIMVDFINMNSEEDKKKLINYIKELISKDKVKTNFIEMTKLDLVELTRMKIERPLYEQLENINPLCK